MPAALAPEQRRPRFELGLRARLFLAFLLPTLALLSLGGFLLYRASRAVLEAELGNSLSALAAAISAQLKADRVLALTPEDAQGEGSRTFRSVTTQLAEARQAAGARRVLVFDRQGRARIDSGGGLPPMAEVPELLRDGAELERVFEGERASSQVLFEGNDGVTYKTGYAPLRLEGAVVGAVAVEGSAAFFVPLGELRTAFLTLAAATLALLGLAAVLTARALSRPLEALVQSALRISAGDLATVVGPQPTREIGILARELELMRQAIEGRDRQLKLMLGGVAHEVRNPLGGIELFSGLLNEELALASPNLPAAQEHLARIRRELDYLKRIVEDFLAYAREQRVAEAPFEASQLVQDAQLHLAGEAAQRGVNLRVTAEPAVLTGDMSLLTSALVNLLKNAIQASASGQLVELAGRGDGDGYVIEVVDQGPGIPEQVRARVFEPFFTTREKGTGLGLPLARKLVEAHRGTLSVDSRPGHTRFTLRLPGTSGALAPRHSP